MKLRRRMGIWVVAALAGIGGCMGPDGPFQTGIGGAGGKGGAGGAVTTGGQGGAGGECPDQCCGPKDCPEPTTVCIGRTCTAGQCGEAMVPEGTASPWQPRGDCKSYLCNAVGKATEVLDASDTYDDQNQCTLDTCDGGNPRNTDVAPGTACTWKGGKYCNADAECVKCIEDAHCNGGLCTPAGDCVPQTCADNMQNNGETDIDCGGPCVAMCDPGQACQVPADCEHGVCQNQVCAAPTCGDLVKNGDETDVDCGGPACPQCGPLQGCNVNTDCVGGQCTGSVCLPNCQDGMRNNAETDVDCGGPSCPKCGLGADCNGAADCQGGHCVDARCCDTACIGECLACAESKTGAPDGSCAPIPYGTDPEDECVPEPAETCGNSTGFCGGDGYCAKHLAGTVCGPVSAGSCSNGVETTPDACDGQGTCHQSTTTACSPYACDGAACGTDCASDADCESGAYCAGQVCLPKKPNGDACGAANECGSGSCVDGVCCNTACGGGAAGDCQACNVQGAAGTCTPRPAGTVCRDATGVCDAAELCDGGGVACPADAVVSAGTVCRAALGQCDVAEVCNGAQKTCPADGYQPVNTPCGSAQSCSGSVQTNQDRCNSTGTCIDFGTTLCSPYNCAGALACDTNCATHSECQPGYYCSAPQCLARKPNGQACASGPECQSGSCVDGVCCNTSCGGGSTSDCQACNVPGSVGTCAVLGANTVCRASAGPCDVHETCNGSATNCPPDAYASSSTVCRPATAYCDLQEMCPGISASCPPDQNRPSGTLCGEAASCSGTVLTNADTCNGSGSCTDGGTTSCSGGCVSGQCTPCQPGSTGQCSGGHRICDDDGTWGACVEPRVINANAMLGRTCATLNGGRIKCWGNNEDGALGLGDTIHRGDNPGEMGTALPAVQLGTGKLVVATSGGFNHICALLSDGGVKCWGVNLWGNLGLGDTTSRGASLTDMGNNLPYVQLGTNKTAVAISGSVYFSCAILNDGGVKCWGGGGAALGIGATNHRGDSPGEMGDNLPYVQLGTGKTAIQIAVGADHACALLNDGSVKCWGGGSYLGLGDSNSRGDDPNEMGDALPAVQLGTGRTAIAISSKYQHTCALLDNGSVKCWGYGGYGELGTGTWEYMRGDAPGEMGDALPPVPLGTGKSAVAIGVGEHFSCALLNDGSVKCWGYNSLGELGIGTTDPRGDNPGELGDALPAVQFGTGKSVASISVGQRHSCALFHDGTVKCWGANGSSLGLGDTNPRGDNPGEMGDALPTVKLFSDIW